MTSRWRRWWMWALAAVVVVCAAAPVVLRYLVWWPMDQWQVDVEVYREAGVSILTGRPVYATLTESPQLLPFTYPPFAALLAVPLALVPFAVAGWVWALAQVAATTAIVWYAARSLLVRTSPWVPLACALVVAPMLWLHPVADGIRFGQVNAFIVLLCLLDVVRPRPRWLSRVPEGVLVGVAMAIKLTPGVFVVHFLVCRRWKEAGVAVGTAVFVTLCTWGVLPEASFAFWGGAVQDPTRLGPNAGTSNQSLRGLVLRVGPDGGAGVAVWVVAVVVVGGGGFWLARQMWRRGVDVDGVVAAGLGSAGAGAGWSGSAGLVRSAGSVGEVAVLGLLACLLSPVAWIHHYHWMVVVIIALALWGWCTQGGLGGLGRRARLMLLVPAGVMLVWFLMRLPWWGVSLMAEPGWWVPGRVLQNADVIGGVVALVLLWWTSRRAGGRRGGGNREPADS